MKGESWNTISDSLTLVLSILISIHHSAERSQRTFSTNESLQPEAWFHFKIRYRLFDKNWKWKRNIFNSMSPLFHFVVDASSNRIHFHSCLSFDPAFLDRETRRAQVRAQVHLSFTSVIWRSVRLRESTIAWNRAPIAIPVEKRLTSVLVLYTLENCVYIYIYACSLKRKYGEIISRRHRRRINNFSTFPGRIAIDNRLS